METYGIRDSKINTVLGSAESNSKILTLNKAIEEGINKDDGIKILLSTLNHYKGLLDYYDEVDDNNGENQNDVNINSAKQSK